MTTHVDIVAEFDDRSVMVSANDLKRNVERTGDETGDAWGKGFTTRAESQVRGARGQFTKAGQDIGGDLGKGMSDGFQRELPRFKAGMADAARSTASFRDEQKKLQDLLRDRAPWDEVVRQSERTATAHNLARTAAHDAGDAFREFETATMAVSDAASGATSALGNLGGAVGKIAGPAVIIALGAAIVELGGVAASASESLLLIPAAAGAAGAAIGTIALATYGFGDALKAVGDPKKFAEALQELSPNAQQAALSIQQLMPAFDQLRKATSDAFFANVGPQLSNLTSQLLPTVQRLTTGISSAFNQMFMALSSQLLTPQLKSSLEDITNNVVSAFQELVPAMAPLTQAFADLVKVGSDFLPDIARGASDAAAAFSDFMREARESGKLHEWIGDGLTTLQQIGTAAYYVGKAFMTLASDGKNSLPGLVEDIKNISDAMSDLVGLLDTASKLLQLITNPAGLGQTLARDVLGTNPTTPTLTGAGSNSALQNMLIPGSTGGAGAGIPAVVAPPGGALSILGGGGGTVLGGAPAPGASGSTGLLPIPSAAAIAGGGVGRAFAPDRSWQATRGPGNTIGGSALAGGGAGSHAGLPQSPALPYDTTLPAGYGNLPQTAEILSAENSFMDARHEVAEKQARAAQLEKDTTATEADRVKANNDVINAKQQQQQAELRLQDAAANLYKKSNQQLDGYASQMGEIGAKLDQDLGISKGLPGLADNLVRFLGNLIAAPELAKLNAISNAPGQAQGGFGLLGVMGAQGAFGQQYTAAGQAAASGQSGYGASAMGPAALQPTGGVAGLGGVSMPGDSVTYTRQEMEKLGIPALYQNPAGGGSPEIPDWVQQFVQRYGGPGLTASSTPHGSASGSGLHGTPGSAGYAVDITGPQAQQDMLAAFLKQNPSLSAMMIHQGADGTPYGVAGGQDVSGRYFTTAGGTYGDEAGMVHWAPASSPGGAVSSSSQSGGFGNLPSPLPVSVSEWHADWNAVAQGESGGNWATNTGNGYSGGLQFTPSSWQAAGGTQYAPAAYQATPYQQALTAEQLLAMQGPGAWPNTFVPGSSGPAPGGPSGLVQPGAASTGLAPVQTPGAMGGNVGGGAGPTQIGAAVSPASGSGQGGIGLAPGGSLDTALGLAASAFPGMGQAAQTGVKLASRAIQFAGQSAAIGVQGLMDTFLPTGGSDLANHSWFSKILGGLAGAAPALPNMAGKAAAAAGKEGQGQQGGGQQGGDTHIHVTEDPNRGADGTGRDVAWHSQQAQLPPGRP